MDKQGNKLTIDMLNAGQRFDKFLLKYLNSAEKSLIYKLLRKKRIKLNGSKADGNELLNDGDIITFYIAPETLASLYDQPVGANCACPLLASQIIYEDTDMLIVNKPVGLLTHSETANDTDTLIDRVITYLHIKGDYTPGQGVFTPVCCNRLDRNTSGIVACAKNLPMAQKLNAAFKERETVKIYTAVVCGMVKDNLTISNHIDDKDALTEISPIWYSEHKGETFTVVKVRLHTGRKHQIRIHLQSVNHPIIGDPRYGNAHLNKHFGVKYQLLHASELTVLGMTFKSDLPKEWNKWVNF